MKKVRVGINGFGRIGRAFFRLAWRRDDIEVVGVNDLGSLESLAYLLSHDSVYRDEPYTASGAANADGVGGTITVTAKDGSRILQIPVFAVKDPASIPWGAHDVDVVVESTGLFTTYDKAGAHIKAGAKKVVISAPAKAGEDATAPGAMIVLNANEGAFAGATVTSNASCTTNAANPLIVILDQTIGIEKAILNTVHAYTASQALVDGPSKKDLREGRAAALNVVPSSTGAAKAIGEVYAGMKGKFDGISIRVPVPAGSIVDVTFIAKRDVTAEEVNDILRKAAAEPKWKGIFTATDEPLVSSDILGDTHASIADLEMTRVVGGNLVKVLAWYDNEMGYSNTLVEHVVKLGQ
jgi:glyceraldehyde 3-phosphate dehydrogenase